VQKSHTKVLLLIFFRSHDGAAGSPIRTLFCRRYWPLHCWRSLRYPWSLLSDAASNCLGSWKLFGRSVLRLPAELPVLVKEIGQQNMLLGKLDYRIRSGPEFPSHRASSTQASRSLAYRGVEPEARCRLPTLVKSAAPT